MCIITHKQQKCGRFNVAVVTGEVQGCVPLFVIRVDLCSMLQKNKNHLHANITILHNPFN